MNATDLARAHQLLAEMGISRQVAATTLDALLAQATVRSFPQDRVLCLRGDPITELSFILDGSVEVSIEDADGRRAICWYSGPGQWLGLISIIDGQGSVHNFRAHTDTTMLCLPRQPFLAAMASDPGLAMLCMNVLCERSRLLYANQAADALMPLRARIARMLLMLMEQHGEAGAGDDIKLRLKITQDDFAAMLGSSRQRLNRELRALEEEGVIAIAYSQISLRDVAALRRAVSEESFD